MPEEKIIWTNEKRKISDLKFAQYNPRQMTKKQAEDLKASIDKFELADPIVINANNTIIGGHMRIRILTEKKVEEVDVRVPNRELSLEEERELNLRLNRNLGEFSYDMLADFDVEKLKIIGFDDDELDKIMGSSENLGYTIDCPYCNEKIKVSNRVKSVEKFIDNQGEWDYN